VRSGVQRDGGLGMREMWLEVGFNGGGSYGIQWRWWFCNLMILR